MDGKWQEEYRRKLVSFEEAARSVQSGDFVSIAIGAGACSPELYEAILDRHEELHNVIMMDSIQLRPTRLYDPEYMKNLDGHINYMPTFGIASIRQAYAHNCDFLVNTVMEGGAISAHRSDVFITMVTPPDKNGYVNLSLTNDYTWQTVKEGRKLGKLRVVIGEVNDQTPVVFGNNWLHISEFDYLIEHSSPVPEFKRGTPTETDKTIANYVLEFIKDGDNIQMGIGGIPEAVVSGLDNRYDLGVITEMYPIGLPELIEKGIVTNRHKPHHPGITMGTFCLGNKEMYDFVDRNPACELHPAFYTNNAVFIAQHPNIVAMNMALMVDMSGQIASEGLGHRMISGSGGQLDFMMGAHWSDGGRGITLVNAARALKDGQLSSAIVPELPLGTPVTVPRSYAQYVISEYGVANLRYKSRRERAHELIAIAHPDLRGELRASLRKNFYPGWMQEQDIGQC